jgi:hypothetical protein
MRFVLAYLLNSVDKKGVVFFFVISQSGEFIFVPTGVSDSILLR